MPPPPLLLSFLSPHFLQLLPSLLKCFCLWEAEGPGGVAAADNTAGRVHKGSPPLPVYRVHAVSVPYSLWRRGIKDAISSPPPLRLSSSCCFPFSFRVVGEGSFLFPFVARATLVSSSLQATPPSLRQPLLCGERERRAKWGGHHHHHADSTTSPLPRPSTPSSFFRGEGVGGLFVRLTSVVPFYHRLEFPIRLGRSRPPLNGDPFLGRMCSWCIPEAVNFFLMGYCNRDIIINRLKSVFSCADFHFRSLPLPPPVGAFTHYVPVSQDWPKEEKMEERRRGGT